MSERQKPHFAYIECARGYAILLVITCHTTYLFPDLPYPVHRVTVLGWHGVQLFFLASAVTLMMSWHFEKARDGSVDIGGFFLRRFFRIAPAYYLTSILYFFVDPPVGGFDFAQAAGTYLFINAWHPVLMGVTPNAWSVVPGSWSIGVEFTFYAVFPILACTITSFTRAICLFIVTLVTAATLNSLLWQFLNTAFDSTVADNFLYFWFPNQMCVFALGLCLFFLLEWNRPSIVRTYPNLIAALSIVTATAAAFVNLPHWIGARLPLPPTFILVSLAFMIFILALKRVPPGGLFLNRPMALVGRVSFSAYLLHIAVLKVISDQPSLQNYLHATGVSAIVAFALALIGIILVVVAASWCVYRVIETPMIGVGKILIHQRRVAASHGLL